jgi:SAM-dependent methyltransferase
MISQRPADAAPVVMAVAEALPFADDAFDASLAALTTHHWPDAARGLAEMRRVSRRQVVLTWDQQVTARTFWFLTQYLPEAAEREADLAALRTVLEHWPDAEVQVVPIPHDCTDGFFAAYWRRPDAFLVPAVRAAISSFAFLDDALVAAALARLEADLATGAWQRRNGHLMELEELDLGYRLVVNT